MAEKKKKSPKPLGSAFFASNEELSQEDIAKAIKGDLSVLDELGLDIDEPLNRQDGNLNVATVQGSTNAIVERSNSANVQPSNNATMQDSNSETVQSSSIAIEQDSNVTIEQSSNIPIDIPSKRKPPSRKKKEANTESPIRGFRLSPVDDMALEIWAKSIRRDRSALVREMIRKTVPAWCYDIAVKALEHRGGKQ